MSLVALESPCAPQATSLAWLAATTARWWAELAYDAENEFIDLVEVASRERSPTGSRALLRARNTYYARAAMLDCLERDEAPFVSHLLYTQVYDDDDARARIHGMTAGAEVTRALLTMGAALAAYDELGVTTGMHSMIDFAERQRAAVERRQLSPIARAWYLRHVPAALAWLV